MTVHEIEVQEFTVRGTAGVDAVPVGAGRPAWWEAGHSVRSGAETGS